MAAILNKEDIHRPVDPITGKPKVNPMLEVKLKKLAIRFMEIEREFFKAGARYITGSGTDVNGTMPGISLHREIQLLTQIGLRDRQAIAAATWNFSEIFGWKEIGDIKPGCRADILVLDGNPLDDIKNLRRIHLLLLKGKIISRENLLKLGSDY